MTFIRVLEGCVLMENAVERSIGDPPRFVSWVLRHPLLTLPLLLVWLVYDCICQWRSWGRWRSINILKALR